VIGEILRALRLLAGEAGAGRTRILIGCSDAGYQGRGTSCFGSEAWETGPARVESKTHDSCYRKIYALSTIYKVLVFEEWAQGFECARKRKKTNG